MLTFVFQDQNSIFSEEIAYCNICKTICLTKRNVCIRSNIHEWFWVKNHENFKRLQTQKVSDLIIFFFFFVWPKRLWPPGLQNIRCFIFFVAYYSYFGFKKEDKMIFKSLAWFIACSSTSLQNHNPGGKLEEQEYWKKELKGYGKLPSRLLHFHTPVFFFVS